MIENMPPLTAAGSIPSVTIGTVSELRTGRVNSAVVRTSGDRQTVSRRGPQRSGLCAPMAHRPTGDPAARIAVSHPRSVSDRGCATVDRGAPGHQFNAHGHRVARALISVSTEVLVAAAPSEPTRLRRGLATTRFVVVERAHAHGLPVADLQRIGVGGMVNGRASPPRGRCG
jgi:hypothetical protein